ncbi:MAG: recombinase family protein [Patescibacteria group bacterium]|nr:recombinase family protein [Patescibacteria group bacterium]
MNCVIYGRVSTDEQAKKDCSIPTQMSKGKIAIAEDGGNLLEVFQDEGLSGSNPNRPGLQEMIAYCKNNSVDYVYVIDTDRLARDESLHFAIKSMLLKSGTKIRSINQPMLDDSPEGRFMDSILAAVNALTPKITGRKTSISMMEKIQVGWWAGPARIGYKNVVNETVTSGFEKNIIALDKEVASLLKKTFKLFATGSYSVEDLCDLMFEEGLRSINGNKIKKQAMINILREVFYTGKIEFKGDIYPGKHEPIIDQDTFETCNEILDQHNKYVDRKRKHQFLLSGYIKCGKCGRHYTAEHHGAKEKAYYHCPVSSSVHSNKLQNISTKELEGMVEELFKNLQLPKRLIGKIVFQAKKYLSQNHNHIDIARNNLLSEQNKLEKQRFNYEEDLGNRVIDSETYIRQTTRIKNELKVLEKKLGKLQINRADNTRVFEELMFLAEDVFKAYLKASPKRKRAYIDLFWNEIIVENRKIKKAVPTELFEALLSLPQVGTQQGESQAHFIKSQLWLPELDSNQ